METAQAKRIATTLFLIAVGFLLVSVYVGLVFWENTIDLGAEFIAGLDLYLWVIILGSILGAILIALLIVYLLTPTRGAPTPVAAEAAYTPTETPFEQVEPDAFVEAPAELAFEEVPPEPVAMEEPAPELAPLPPPEPIIEPEPEPVRAAPPPPVPVEADVDALLVKCSNCSNEFEIPYSTERPLRATCPKCNEVAVLLEDGVGPIDGTPVIEIEGIGNLFAEKLVRQGVRTTEDLRRANARKLADSTGIPLASIKSWQAMADFMRLPGIGKQFAELLARTGIHGVTALAGENAKQLSRKIKAYVSTLEAPPVKAGVDEKRAQKWIQAAKKLKAKSK